MVESPLVDRCPERVAHKALPQTPPFRLHGKHALVTGAGRGIGLAAAAALAQAGADVVLVSRTAVEIEAATEAIRSAGGSALCVPMDIGDRSQFHRLDPHGPYDILVNAAGVSLAAAFADVSVEAFDKVISLNLKATFFLTQYVVAALVADGKAGSIINISSTLGKVGLAERSVYSASKFGLEGLTKSLALELGAKGVRVNTLCPTLIETDMVRDLLKEPRYRDMVLSKIKLGRLGRLEDVMGAVVFLASDASELMTGSSLVVDGGWTAE
jgi:NAD(P)-dependent dehydrogenase (short-subunit alcohol dehydrogenase family)